MLQLELGDVFTWEQYPYHIEGEPKRRWFVYLGEYKENPDPFEGNVMIIAPTTTTQIHYYEPRESRARNPHVRFTPEDGFGFAAESVLDLSNEHIVVAKSVFRSNETSINVRGKVSHARLRLIYEKIRASTGYSPKSKAQIYENLKHAGISGLQPPARRAGRK